VTDRFDFAVIGSGPGGQKAAVCAAKAGRRVALIERDRLLGGACVHHGTIPSKTLRENALRVEQLRRTARLLAAAPREDLELSELLGRLEEVVSHYSRTVEDQLRRNRITCIHGRARFVSDRELEVYAPDGSRRRLEAGHVVVAAGSRPRCPDGIPVDHEHVLDADSILSLAYLPRSLAVLGGGVIACEFASIFACLGVEVTVVDRGPRPLGFLDVELVDGFQRAFEAAGGRVLSQRRLADAGFDGVSRVRLALEGGEAIEAEKVFVALGRTGCLDGLGLDAAGLAPGPRGTLEVDEHGRTAVPHIYAVGDVAGPPALATVAMEQGRCAVRHALGLGASSVAGIVPTGIYTIPEMASVGMTEAEAVASCGGARVGRAGFEEVARVQISDAGPGLLKLVADPEGERILGVHVLGQGATDLVHVGQMAILAGARVDDIVENVFNFPTLAETYRIAALDLLNHLRDEREKPPADA